MRPTIDSKTKTGLPRRALWAAVALAVLLYAFFSFFALQKPFNLDEGDFASLAHYIGSTGKPILYVAQDYVKDACSLDLYSVEQHLGFGLWHAPLYGNALALWFKLFGESTVSGRLFGLFCALASLWLCLRIARVVCVQEEGRDKSALVSVITAVLFLVNPLIVQFALLLDIDNSILTALMLLFFYVAMKNCGRVSLKEDLFLGAILGVSLLAKLSTPPLIPVSLFIFYCLKGEPGKAFKRVFVITVAGVLFFLVAWVTYAKLLRLPLDFCLVYNYGTKVAPAVGSGSLFYWPSILRTAVYFVAWVSPAMIVLAAIGIGAQLVGWFKTKKMPALLSRY